MIYYASGNFVYMKDREKELQFIREVKKRGFDANRLISFFFAEEREMIMDIKDKGKLDADI